VTASLVGAYAGLLGMVHGYFELLQGSIRPDGLIFNAIGEPCRPETVYHACLPAMTIIPNLHLSGILALVVGLVMVIWSTMFVEQRHGGLVLMLISLLLLLVGGGFIPAFTGLIAGAAATRIHSNFRWWERLPGGLSHFLAGFWPWLLLAYFLWLATQWLLGIFANEFVLGLGGWPLLVELGLLLTAVISSFAFDIQTTEK
jgi:hypothetical protein